MKLSDAVSRTTWPKSIVALTRTGVYDIGRMYRRSTSQRDAPIAVADSTNSR
jgi:hypothetical protein